VGDTKDRLIAEQQDNTTKRATFGVLKAIESVHDLGIAWASLTIEERQQVETNIIKAIKRALLEE
jgi:hypothetical protein